MDQQQLRKILDDHRLWSDSNGERGKRADLRRVDLRGAELQGAHLRGADLRGADLQGANLQVADLQGADLQGADLQGADLQGANLWGANLQRADLRGADLRRANLQGAELQGANLQGADLRGANLQGAGLLVVKLEGAKYNPERLQVARNVPPEYLSDAKPTSTDVYQRRAKDAQSKVTALEREKLELESELKAAKQGSAQSASLKQSLKAAEIKLNQVRNQLEQNQQKQEILDELAGAIEPILEAVKSDKETVEDYKLQSQRLLKWGLVSFGFATGFIIWKGVCPALPWQALCAAQNVSGAVLLLQIAPGFVFAILGSALLRHDWKIRQLTLSLIDQNNSVDIAMGMLKTALRLSNIGDKKDIEGIPDLVKESFVEVRRALLYRNRSDAPAPDDDGGKDAAELIKQLKSLIPKSPSAGSTNPPSS